MELVLRTTLHKAYPAPPCENHPTRMEALEKETRNYIAGFMNTGAKRRMPGICMHASWVALRDGTSEKQSLGVRSELKLRRERSTLSRKCTYMRGKTEGVCRQGWM